MHSGTRTIAERFEKDGSSPSWEDLRVENEVLRAQVAVLQAQIAELMRQLNRNSQNSHQPPSSDGLKKAIRRGRTQSLREKSKTRSGGQEGHPGKTLALSPQPDKVEDHYPAHCTRCGAALPPDPQSPYQARQVHDLLSTPPAPDVTEHRAHRQTCPACGAETAASFPKGVSAPVQYGPHISACVVYLRNQHFMPEARLSQIMKDLFNSTISKATIGQMTKRLAHALAPVAACIREQIVQAPVKHLDETGCRVNKTLRWLHVASTKEFTHYRIGKRGDVPTDMTGTVMHDHWKSYRSLIKARHAYCNVHHLRECQALIENEKEDWARQMAIVLRRANHAVNLAQKRQQTLSFTLIGLIERQYDRVVEKGIAFHQALPALPQKPRGKPALRRGHNLLNRLKDHRDETLRFLHDPNVPFSNNLGEQDIRMAKLRDKTSGCSRSEAGASEFATVRSVTSTARKKGWNVLQILKDAAKDAAQSIIDRIVPKPA